MLGEAEKAKESGTCVFSLPLVLDFVNHRDYWPGRRCSLVRNVGQPAGLPGSAQAAVAPRISINKAIVCVYRLPFKIQLLQISGGS